MLWCTLKKKLMMILDQNHLSGTQIDSWEKIVMHRYNSGLLHPYIEYYYIPSLITLFTQCCYDQIRVPC
jgi:hypothetical protein